MPNYLRLKLETEDYSLAKRLKNKLKKYLRQLQHELEFSFVLEKAVPYDLEALEIGFGPNDIRNHFRMRQDLNREPPPPELEQVSDLKLYEAALGFIDSDTLWEDFHTVCLEIVKEAATPETAEAQPLGAGT